LVKMNVSKRAQRSFYSSHRCLHVDCLNSTDEKIDVQKKSMYPVIGLD
jgi:hypothetical protein